MTEVDDRSGGKLPTRWWKQEAGGGEDEDDRIRRWSCTWGWVVLSHIARRVTCYLPPFLYKFSVTYKIV